MFVRIDGFVARVGGSLYRWLQANKDALHGWYSRQLTMYDSIDITEIPAKAKAAAGYVDGRWPTFEHLPATIPHRLSIAVFARDDAHALDIEQYDATIPEAAPWVRRQLERGVTRPVVYTSISQARALVDALGAAGLPRSSYRLWTAHYTYRPHLCDQRCGFGFDGKADATQYTNRALGRNLDASLCARGFFG